MKRNVLNLAMTGLLLLVMNYRFTGNETHELLGLLTCALFFLHNQWNRRWYGALRKGAWTPRRLLTTGVNGLLLAAMLAALASGALISQTVFAPLALQGSLRLHEIHTAAAYGAFLLTAVHLGLHWDMLASRLRRFLGITRRSAADRYLCHAAAICLMGYGIHASLTQHIGAKLLAEHPFELWGVAPSLLGFTLDYLAIWGLYTGATHYALRALQALR